MNFTFDTYTDELVHTCSVQRRSGDHTVTDATNTAPIVVTIAGHPFDDNSTLTIAGVVGNTAANGEWFLQAVSDNTFELIGSTGNGGYVSGGTATGLDGSGQEINRFTLLAAGVSCRLEAQLGFGEPDHRVVNTREMIGDFLLYWAAGQDVVEKDRIINVVRTADSVAIDAGPFTVLDILLAENDGSEHHREARMDRTED